ncbi:MAG: serine/threonine-protein kinase [Polyangiales bacterium]
MSWRCPVCGQRYRTNAPRCPFDDAALEPEPDPWLGRVIDRRYEVLERIGEGGMGVVYRARHAALRREVAIKVLEGEYAADSVRAKRFVREARAANLLRHEAVIDVHDIGECDGALYLVMDLLRGEALSARIARGPMPAAEVAAWAAPVADALGRAHALGVIHRDIKPGNVFLCDAPGRARVRVLDFGVAHVRDETPLTRQHELIGTHEYLAPELLLRAPCTPASDLYALGVTMFEALTGRLPFEGPRQAAGARRAQEPAPDVRALEPSAPGWLASLVASLLERDPARRPPGAAAVLDALRLGAAAPPADARASLAALRA